ncbi:MAG: hypothetical protein AAB615_02330, partial [Patescibacteria group bacterium]
NPVQSATIVVDGKVIGLIGSLHPSVAKNFGIPGERICIAGISMRRLQEALKEVVIFEPLQKFPYALRDVSITFPKSIAVADVQKVFAEAGGELLKKSELFDIYEQDADKRLAFHLYFGADDRTLTSDEMNATFEKITQAVSEKLEGKI